MNALNQTWKQLFEQEKKKWEQDSGKDIWKPYLHVVPPFGWINDPNGLCQYQGVYHVFYQFSPFQAEGGLKFWGHSTSRDLLHWEFQGLALMPDEVFDCHGVYSGSALVEEDTLYLYYTGNVKHLGSYDHIHTGRESNTVLAVSKDGITFSKKQLLMTNQDYPEDVVLHVRDPKIRRSQGTYYMVQGARTKEDRGIVLVFSSEDKVNWKCTGRIMSEEPFGYMWECPDLFELDGKEVLCVSPQGISADGLLYNNIYQSVSCFLEGDFRKAAKTGIFRELDGGFDFYAPQSFQADDGRRILIGWMGMADAKAQYTNKTVEYGWQHVLTIPRELSVRNDILCQNPVRELENWWNERTPLSNHCSKKVESCCELEFSDIRGSIFIEIAGGLKLQYDRKEKIFWMYFTENSLGSGRTKRGRKLADLTNMRILIDVSCVEVFLNGGTDVFSTRFYPEGMQYEIKIDGTECNGVYKRHL